MDDSRRVDDFIARSQRWQGEITALRPLLLDGGLTEEIKWGKPCYTHDGKNVVIVQEMKDFVALMFFKGALMSDPVGILRDQGPNSRSAKRIEITSVDDVDRLGGSLAAYVDEAIRIEDAGLEAGPPPELDLVAELRDRLDADPTLRASFEALTPGRQREYNMYFSGAKQAATRERRIERYVQQILDGKGLRDR